MFCNFSTRIFLLVQFETSIKNQKELIKGILSEEVESGPFRKILVLPGNRVLFNRNYDYWDITDDVVKLER